MRSISKRIALRDYKKYYDDPISVHAGDVVAWKKKESEWAGWTWCIHPVTQKEGWIPDQYLRKEVTNALVLRDYSARELNAKTGDEFVVLFEEAGWIWCQNQENQTGWLPRELFDNMDD